MRLLIVAVPCVCCCRGSRHYSTSAWHHCLFQFHLIALVIKRGADTTHHIIALITSELHCVHMTISLTRTPIPSLPLHPSSLLHLTLTLFSVTDLTSCFIHHTWLSSICTVTNDFRFTKIHSMIISKTSYANYASGQVVGVMGVTNSDGAQCGLPTLCEK